MKNLAFLLILLLTSCALNADQEASLNSAMTSYINSRNNGVVMSYVAFTHPNAVAYYKKMGDKDFTEKFTLVDSVEAPFLQDGNIRNIEKKDKNIHVKYRFLLINNPYYDEKAEESTIMAVSEDEGVSWFFIEEIDYFNDDIIKPKDRLIKKK